MSTNNQNTTLRKNLIQPTIEIDNISLIDQTENEMYKLFLSRELNQTYLCTGNCIHTGTV